MKMTRTLPTDRRGNVYYGATTTRDALERISRATSDDLDLPRDQRKGVARIVAEAVADLESAGYHGVAARVRRYYA